MRGEGVRSPGMTVQTGGKEERGRECVCVCVCVYVCAYRICHGNIMIRKVKEAFNRPDTESQWNRYTEAQIAIGTDRQRHR